MSVTFDPNKAVFTRVRVLCGEEYNHDCTPENPCPFCNEGYVTVTRSSAPSLNFANGNAREILGILGFGNSLVGSCHVEGVTEALARVNAILESPLMVQLHTRPTLVDRTGGCAIFDCGIDEYYIRTRLSEMRALLQWAIDHDSGINWA